MPSDPSRDLRFLKGYAFATTTLLVVLSLAAFHEPKHPHFDEIDVGRINVVEPDGTLRLTISNKAKLPDPVIGGKSYPLRGGTGAGAAGFIFFNDEGNENGGLIYQGARDAKGYHASAHLTFDQFNQDETVALSYGDRSGRRQAGLTISDRPDVSIQAFAESAMVLRKLPDGPEKTRRAEQLEQYMATTGMVSAPRVYVGKESDKSATVVLSDPQGRARLRLVVDSLGAPRIELLDDGGHVTYRIPDTAR